jgi:hypothetical protein
MINKKLVYFLSVACIFLFVAIVILLLRLPEDRWIRDSKGIWIKYGNPSDVPLRVFDQKNAIACAIDLYNQTSKEEISSQCIGSCGDYAVDLVHVPREEVDNRMENQCEDYRLRRVNHFIELDLDGNIVRIV